MCVVKCTKAYIIRFAIVERARRSRLLRGYRWSPVV